MNHHQGLLVCRQLRIGVVVAYEGHAFGVVATQALLVDLRLAGTVGGEVDRPPVGTPERLRVDRIMIGEPLQLARAEVHHIDFRITILRQYERQAIAVR